MKYVSESIIWYISEDHIQFMSIEVLNRELDKTEMSAISGAIRNTLGKQFDETIKSALRDVIGVSNV